VRILDLFCGAGGAAMGLHRAFPEAEIVGVDIEPQPHYPFSFIQADALTFPLCGFVGGSMDHYPELCDRCGAHCDEHFDFVWASPPCQAHSRLNGINRKEYTDFIGPIRLHLQQVDLDFVIENVVGAPLLNPLTLCGSMFGLGVWRHRIFEIHGRVVDRLECRHDLCKYPLDVTGTGGPCATRTTAGGGLHRKPKNMKQASDAMGIDWMTRRELTQAIPPAYSEYIANQFKESQRCA
jgi:DNA (cytosine-5)-methyltransferase 1